VTAISTQSEEIPDPLLEGPCVRAADTTMRPPSGENLTALLISSSIALDSHLRSAVTGKRAAAVA